MIGSELWNRVMGKTYSLGTLRLILVNVNYMDCGLKIALL